MVGSPRSRIGFAVATIAILLSLPLVARGRPEPSMPAGAMQGLGRSVRPPVVTPERSAAGAAPSVDAYRGLGSWIDIYDSAWAHPAASVREMAERGVRTLYLQTSNFSRGRPFVHREGVEAFVDAAAGAGIEVVAWYLPGFRDVALDARRSIAAVRFRTPAGNAFDSFALDIESPEVRRPASRSARLLRVSAILRRAAGSRYPLGAIVPSPRALRSNAWYWPRFPFGRLAREYDVFLPMTYFTWRVHGERGAHWYTAQNIDIIREEVGDRSVPIHVIGGIGGEATAAETNGFVRAVRERGVLGASYYTFPLTTDGDWRALARIRANPIQDPALPLGLPFDGEVGNVPGVDGSHPNEVVFRVGGVRGSAALRFQAYDLQRREVEIYVNWRRLAPVSPSRAVGWDRVRERRIPDRLLNDAGANYIVFVAADRGLEPSAWGVRDLELVRRDGR